MGFFLRTSSIIPGSIIRWDISILDHRSRSNATFCHLRQTHAQLTKAGLNWIILKIRNKTSSGNNEK